LSQKLSDITGKKVIIEPEYVDTSLIGGVIVRVAGKLLDGSTRNKLAALKKEIS
jgi:F0F1-type ATP synthase delta subunit